MSPLPPDTITPVRCTHPVNCSLLEPMLGAQAGSPDAGTGRSEADQLLQVCGPLLRRAAVARNFDLVRKVQQKLKEMGLKAEPSIYAECLVAAATVGGSITTTSMTAAHCDPFLMPWLHLCRLMT